MGQHGGFDASLAAWSERAWSRFRVWPDALKVVAWVVGWWLLIPLLAWRSGLGRGLKIVLSLVPVGVLVGASVAIAAAPSNQPKHIAIARTHRTSPSAVMPPSRSPAAVSPSPHHAKQRKVAHLHLKPRHRSSPSPALPSVACPSAALRGVYHSSRLHVLGTCRWFVGTVTSVRHEEDGDYHVDVAPASGYARFLDSDNYSEQHGSLVTEIMPGQHLRVPFVGEHVAVFGTWVLDADHGWNEIHPIWGIRYGGGRVVGVLPPATPLYDGESGGSNTGGSSTGGGGSNCTPGYSPCLPEGPSDYDCAGGGGDGPAYTKPGVTYRVTGSDPYRLDSDGNGYGCE